MIVLNMALAAPAAEPVTETLEVRQGSSHPKQCQKPHMVKAGEYCWLIANNNGMTLAQFMNKNPGLTCENLQIGVTVCI